MFALDVITSLFAAALNFIMIGASLFAGAWCGVWIAEATKKQWAGWLAGLSIGAGLIVVTMPIHDALKRIECKNSEYYQECIDGENDE